MTTPADIFTYIDRRPHLDPIYICGSGPSLTSALPRIPKTATTIALNSAIRADREFTFWFAFDLGMMKLYPWWHTITLPDETCTVFGIALAQAHLPTEECRSGRIPLHYSFQYRARISGQYNREIMGGTPSSPLLHGYLQGNISIAGCAVQFAAWAGARKIILAGVDMRGNQHFDASVNAKMTTGEWGIAKKLRWLSASLKTQHGIDVVSLTPTALNVPII